MYYTTGAEFICERSSDAVNVPQRIGYFRARIVHKNSDKHGLARLPIVLTHAWLVYQSWTGRSQPCPAKAIHLELYATHECFFLNSYGKSE